MFRLVTEVDGRHGHQAALWRLGLLPPARPGASGRHNAVLALLQDSPDVFRVEQPRFHRLQACLNSSCH
jgi:hypothetical protein